MKSKGNGLVSEARPGMKNKKVDTGNIGKKGTVVKSMKPNTALAEWQSRFCKSCKYADAKAVGSGLPCCNHPEIITTDSEGRCLLWWLQEKVKQKYICLDCGIEISSLAMYRFEDNMLLCKKCRGE